MVNPFDFDSIHEQNKTGNNEWADLVPTLTYIMVPDARLHGFTYAWKID